MLKRLRNHHSEASVQSWNFPNQEMQRKFRVLTGGNGENSQRRALGCFGGCLLETYFSTKKIVTLFHTKTECISTKDVVHALEIRSDLAECVLTQRMNGKWT